MRVYHNNVFSIDIKLTQAEWDDVVSFVKTEKESVISGQFGQIRINIVEPPNKKRLQAPPSPRELYMPPQDGLMLYREETNKNKDNNNDVNPTFN
jgi:hypothetical protein